MSAKKQLAPAFIVEKAKNHVLFTGTALIPGEPDCDYANGEKILSEQEVAKMAHEYIENYRIVDKEHEYFQTKEEIGTPLESYLLPAPMIMKSIDGVEREYPKGTWIVKTRITDPEIMAKAEDGKVAYSVTALPKESAEKLIAEKGRVLIKDLEDPVVYTLSLTEFPCVNNSCSTKSDAAVKEGRSISKENKTILEKARDAAKEAIDSFNNLLSKSQKTGEENMTEETKKDFVTKSEIEELVKDLIKEVIASIEKEEAVEEVEEAEEEAEEADESTKEEVEKSEEEDVEEETGSKAIKNHDDGKEEPVFKSMEFYMGRDLRGRPVKKEE